LSAPPGHGILAVVLEAVDATSRYSYQQNDGHLVAVGSRAG
jgi:hypothetical protein